MERRKPRIYVDADACPVKHEIAGIARAFHVEAVMVASYDHHLPPMESVTIIQVDRARQSVDMYIANLLASKDILITHDLGLAAMGLAKKAFVISFRGTQYTDQNIDFLLDTRYAFAKLRRSKGRSAGPKPFTNSDRIRFERTLTKLLQSLRACGWLQ